MNTRYLIHSKHLQLVLMLLLGCLGVGCEKGFLDAKPDKALLVPSTLAHYQALLDNALSIMNRSPYLGEVASDNFYMAANSFTSFSETERNAHIWAERVYSSPSVSDWDLPYKQIFYANVVLDGLKDHPSGEEVKDLQGKALFYRAWALFQAAQVFGDPYDPKNAGVRRGIPVRVSADVTLPSQTGTLQDTYERIRLDLQSAISLLRPEEPVSTRPGRTAAYAALARLHLVLQDYTRAKLYADSTLSLQSSLLDYNELDPAKAYALPALYGNVNRNPEVIFLSILGSGNFLNTNNNTLVDTSLYNSYAEDDLRKVIFFNKDKAFRGSYMGERSYQFSGLAVDEIYLIRAEANARNGDTDAAAADLNRLLLKRWKKDKYDSVKTGNSEELLAKILIERRKELLARGIRWSDLKRLNQDPRFRKVISRNIDGRIYSLSPEDPRYTFPTPDSEAGF